LNIFATLRLATHFTQQMWITASDRDYPYLLLRLLRIVPWVCASLFPIDLSATCINYA